MAIKYLDKIVSGIPTTIVDGQDVSHVMLINPPSLPPFLMQNKAVLDTASNSIKVYDESGNFSLEIDLNKADLTEVIEAIEAVDARVDDTDGNVSDLTLRIETNEGDIVDINAEIVRVEGKLDSEILRINANENGLSEVKGIAEAADTLSKDNAARLDAIDPDDVGDLVQQISDNKSDIADIKSDQEIDQANISDNAGDIDDLKKNIAALNLEIEAANTLSGEAKTEAEEATSIAGTALAKAEENEEKIGKRDEDIEKLQAYLSGLDGRVTRNEQDIQTNITDIKTATSAAATAQDRADAAHEKAQAAQNESIANSVTIAANAAAATANKVQLTSQKEQIRVLEGTTAANTAAVSKANRTANKAKRVAESAQATASKNTSTIATTNELLERTVGLVDTNISNISTINGKVDTLEGKVTTNNTEINGRVDTLEGTVGANKTEIDGKFDGLEFRVETNEININLIQEEFNIEGIGGIYRQGSDIQTARITSTGTIITDDVFFPPENEAETADSDDGLPTSQPGTFQFYKANGDDTYTQLLTIDETSFNAFNKPFQNVASGGDTDTNVANIGDVKRIAVSEGGGLKPVDNKWDMLTYPLINVGSIGFNEQISSSGDGASFARFTTGDLQLGASGIVYIDVNGTTRFSVDINKIDMTGSPLVLAKNSPEEGRSPYELINWETLQNMPDKGLIPFNDTWFMDGYAMVGVPSIGHRSDETGARATYEEYTAKILADNIQFVTQNDSGHYVDINASGVDVNNLEIKNVKESSEHTNAATVGQVKAVESKVDGLTIPDDVSEQVSTNTSNISTITTTANNADTLSKANAEALENALLSDEYGWDADSQNIYNVSRLSRTNNAVNSSGLSIGDADVNLHADTVGITNSNSSITYAVFSAGGLNLNDYPLTRMGSGGDNDTNAATIGDVKRISADGGGLKPTDEEWDMLGYPLTNIGESEVETSASTVGQLNAVKSTADAADALSKANQAAINNLPAAPNLDGYAKLDTDVSFHKVSANGIDFTDADSDVVIQQKSGKKVELKVGATVNVELTDAGMKFGRDVNASSQNITNMGDISFSGNAALIGHSTGDLVILNLKKISRNDSNDANSITLDSGFNTYKSNAHNFETNDGLELLSLDSNGIHLKNSHADSKGDTNIRVDSNNQNTVYDHIGLVYFNTIDKDSGEKKRIFLTSQGGATTFDHAVRSKEGFTNGTATFNTNTDKSAFIDFRTDSEVKIGAHSKVRFTLEGKTPLVVTKDSLDFSSLDSTMKITHDHNIDVIVSGTTNVAFKSNGMKLLSAVDANGQTINHSGDIHFNSGKKLYGSGAGNLEVRNTGAIYRGDGSGSNIQFDATNDIRTTGDHIRWYHTDGTQYGGISKTGINLRDTTKIVGLPKGEDDTDATNIGHIKELIAANGAGGGIEFKKVKKNVTGSPQYVYHNGDNHMYIEYTGNGGTVSLDTMRNNIADQVEDMVVLHNKTAYDCSIRLFFDGSSVLHTVKPFSYIHGWANREIGEWVVTKMADPNSLPHPMVVPLSSLNIAADSDPRTVTKRIISAMPNNSICISNHTNNSGTSKYRFISRGDSKNPETTDSTAIIVKSTDGRATGLSTTKTSSGKAYSRVLDGSRGAWFTNDSSNSFSLADDIDLDQYPEDQLFLTGDQGMMKSEVNEDGENSLVPIAGYNVPKQEQDIQALQAEAVSNRVITQIFKNESLVTIPYTQEHPVVEVFVLDGSETINGSGLTMIDDDTHKYSGVYNTVGSVSLYDNKWTTFSYHNAYKHDSQNYYVVFDQSLTSWVILDTDVIHTSIGEDVGNTEKISLNHTGLLPESFGSYNITLSIDDVSSLEFIKAEANTRIDTDAKTVIVDFGMSKPSGKIVIK